MHIGAYWCRTAGDNFNFGNKEQCLVDSTGDIGIGIVFIVDDYDVNLGNNEQCVVNANGDTTEIDCRSLR